MFKLTTLALPHQLDALEWAKKRPLGGLIAAEMGLGKTYISFMILQWLMQERETEFERALFVTPKAVVKQAYEQLLVHSDISAKVVQLFVGPKRVINESAIIIFTTYDTLVSEFKKHSDIFNMHFDIIFLDEAHQLRNPKTQKFAAVKSLSFGCSGSIWALSGTPVINSTKDLNQLNQIIGYCITPSVDYDDWCAEAMLYIPKDIITLPPKHINVHQLEMTSVQTACYNAIRYSCRAALADLLRQPKKLAYYCLVATIMRLKQAAISPVLLDHDGVLEYEDSNKMVRLCELIESTPEDDQILVFSQFNEVISMVIEMLADYYDVLAYNGLISTSERERNIDSFRKGKAKILVCNIQCASTGLNLSNANHVIFIDLWWNSAAHKQAIDRAHRIGQTKPVHVHYLLSSESVDKWIYHVQDEKIKVVPDCDLLQELYNKTVLPSTE